jgi:5-methyltetrahydrofolate--homocysteine methyltransferase
VIIIGEKINTARAGVLRAYREKDAAHIRNEAIRQAEAGADVIDVNAGMGTDVDPDNMAWAVRIVQDAVDIPLCIDSPDPSTIRAGFKACREKSKAWANSITLQRTRIEGILPLVKEFGCPVIALCLDDAGIPKTAEGRIENAKRLVEMVDSYGISLEKLYLDPLIEPISVRSDGGLVCLDTVRGIKSSIPGIKTVICLSAISFGLPRRKVMNRVYLPLLMYAGIDAVILDPLDSELMRVLKVADTLLGLDKGCVHYLRMYREGGL